MSDKNEELITTNENLRNEIIKLEKEQENKESKFVQLFNEMKKYHYKEV